MFNLKIIRDVKINNQLFWNFISLVVLKGFQFIIPLVSLPYLVRTIGIDKFGLINFALSLGVYFSAIIQYGFSITATRKISRNRDDLQKVEHIYSVTIFSACLLALISFFIFLSIVIFVDEFNNYFLLYLYTILFVIFQNIFPIWFFQGMEKMKFITILTFISNLLYIISLFIFIKGPDDFIFVPLLNAISSSFTLILSLIIIRFSFGVKLIRPKMKDMIMLYLSGRHVFLSQFIPNIYTNSVTFLIGYLTNATVLGLFVSATKIIDALGSLGYVLSNTFFPYLARNIKRHNVFERIMILSSIIICSTVFIFSNNIIEILYSNIDPIVNIYLKLLSFVIPLIFIQLTYGQNYLMLVGKDIFVRNIIIIVSLISISYSVPLIYYFDAWGGIATLIITRVIISLLFYMGYVKHEKEII